MKLSFDNIIGMKFLNIESINIKSDNVELTFENYFKSNYASLCRYAFTFVQDKDTAEDIAQEVFFNVWKSIKPGKHSEIKKAYLYKSVRNHSLNHLKHTKVKNTYAEQECYNNTLNEITPENESIASELSVEIDKAIGKLPVKQREVFVLSRKNELTYKEIALVMEISVKTVEAQMGSALKFLRKHLSHFLPLF